MAAQTSEAVSNPMQVATADQGDPQRQRQHEGAKEQQANAAKQQGTPDLPPETPISLALSGGGFRATLFHLGALWFLHQAGRLRDVRWICSVSGGSILAAHVVKHWAEFASGNDDRFTKAAEGLIRFVRADARGRIFRGHILLVLLYCSSVPLIAWLYSCDALAYVLQLAHYVSIPVPSIPKPWVYLLVLALAFALSLYSLLILFWISDWIIKWATKLSLVHWVLPAVVLCLYFFLGWFPWIALGLFLLILWQLLLLDPRLFTWLPWARPTRLLHHHYDLFLFGGESMSSLPAIANVHPELHLLATNMTTGKLCSFSAAGYIEDALQFYPAPPPPGPFQGGTLPIATGVTASSAFPPVFPPVVLRKKRDLTNIGYHHRLTDGGVNDNLGITLLKAARPATDLRIVSDAGASFDADTDQRFRLRASWIVRVTDVLMRRVAEGDSANFAGQPMCLLWAIQSVPQKATNGIEPDFAARLERVRTDLDAFSELEVRALVLHGYAVARESWCGKFGARSTQGWDAKGAGTAGLLLRLEEGWCRLAENWRGDELLHPRTPENTKKKLQRASSRLRLDVSLLAYIPALLLAAFVALVCFDQGYRQPNKTRLVQAEQRYATEVKDAVWSALQHFNSAMSETPPLEPPGDPNASGEVLERRVLIWKEYRLRLISTAGDRTSFEKLSGLPGKFYGELTQPTLGYVNYDEIARRMFADALAELKLTTDGLARLIKNEINAAHGSAREQLADTIRCRVRAAALRLADSRGEIVPRKLMDAVVPEMERIRVYKDEKSDVHMQFEYSRGRMLNGQLCYELINSLDDRPNELPYSPRRAVVVRESDQKSVHLRIASARFDPHWYVRLVVEYATEDPEVGKAVHVAPNN